MDLYFEMYAGIAGDMIIGALLDLGASKEKLIDAISSLNLSGYKLVFERVKKNGIDSYKFDVLLEKEKNFFKHQSLKSNFTIKKISINKTLKIKKIRDMRRHNHRSISDIEKIINKADLNENIKKSSLKMFNIIAEAESKAHGVSIEEVHFHEVGAVDSIIDIVGINILLDDLQVKNIYFSKLFEGIGYQKVSHGYMPIPVPAVVNIFAGTGIKISIIDEKGEHITPTGASFVKAFYNNKKLQDFSIRRIGIGAGNRDFEKSTNILRIMELEEEKKEKVVLIETNIDDSSGEILGYTMEKLQKYALDVFYTSIYMKKNRPAYKLSVISNISQEENIKDIIFKDTTSIGIRKIELEREILERKKEILEYDGLSLEYKLVFYKEDKFVYPEYESAKKLAKKFEISIKKAFDIMKEIYKNEGRNIK